MCLITNSLKQRLTPDIYEWANVSQNTMFIPRSMGSICIYTLYRQYSFTIWLPRIWNKLPTQLRQRYKQSSFKHSLLEHFHDKLKVQSRIVQPTQMTNDSWLIQTEHTECIQLFQLQNLVFLFHTLNLKTKCTCPP